MHQRNSRRWFQRALCTFSRVALVAAGSAGFIVGSCYMLQNKILYHPRKYTDEGMGSYYKSQEKGFNKYLRSIGRQPMQKLCYQVPQIGSTQHCAWHIPANSTCASTAVVTEAETTRGVLWVVFGGNAMLSLDWLQFIHGYIQHSKSRGTKDVSFLLIDYPGYGLNRHGGLFPSPENILLSSKAAVREALRQHHSPRPPVLRILGHSLGCAASLQLAADKDFRDELGETDAADGGLDRVVLSAPFTSITDMAREIFWSSLPSALIRHPWDNVAAITSLVSDYSSVSMEEDSPPQLSITIIHGIEDEIVPVQQGRALHHTVNEIVARRTDVNKDHAMVTAQFIPLAGVHHNDLLSVASDTVIAAMDDTFSVPSSI